MIQPHQDMAPLLSVSVESSFYTHQQMSFPPVSEADYSLSNFGRWFNMNTGGIFYQQSCSTCWPLMFYRRLTLDNSLFTQYTTYINNYLFLHVWLLVTHGFSRYPVWPVRWVMEFLKKKKSQYIFAMLVIHARIHQTKAGTRQGITIYPQRQVNSCLFVCFKFSLFSIFD